ncbi:MAG: response regulator transcription factor [Anaerolineaceae bacterium]|nr:response regulator transcription factor [Anaerolineaceae bacterium]
MIRILLADDHPLIRAGLRATLELEEDMGVIAEATDGAEAQRLCEELSPDALLLDLGMPGPSPSTTVNFILGRCPQVKIIILTAYDDEVYVRNLVGMGVAGYILKDEAPETLVRAIRAALEGDTWFSRRVIDILAKPGMEPGRAERGDRLTDREFEVLSLLAKGHTNPQIAEVLDIAEGTVKNHLVNVYQKLDVHSRAEAVSWAWQHAANQ